MLSWHTKAVLHLNLSTISWKAVEKKLEEANAESKLRKKIYNVLVESLQNLFHHIEMYHEGIKEDLDPKFGVTGD